MLLALDPRGPKDVRSNDEQVILSLTHDSALSSIHPDRILRYLEPDEKCQCLSSMCTGDTNEMDHPSMFNLAPNLPP